MRALIFRHVQPFATPGTAARLLCSWYSLGKNTDPSLVAQRIKRLPAVQEARVQSLRREDPLEKEMATHSSILAGKSHRGALWAAVHGAIKELDTT